MGVEINWQAPMSYDVLVPAVVYARYSSAGQNEQSIEGQLSKAREYAAAHGYKIVHEYVDRAKTGRNDNREAFQQMLRDTAKRQFQVIILWKVDRFGRNREEIALNKYRCKKNGVRVEYVAENIPSSPEGVILESVLEGMAEYFSLQLSQNVRRGQQKSAEKCQFTGGAGTLGYKVGPDKRFEIDPETAPAVKLIFEKYLAGATIREITTELNDKGYRTMQGKPFTKNSLDTILRNEKYIGVYAYKDIRVEGGVPQIIDDETFYRVQAQLKVNRRAPAHRWSKADYVLTDKLFCGHCETPMVGESGFSKTGTKHCYYTCGKKKREHTCKKKNIRQDVIEPLVIDAALTILHDDELLEFIIDRTWNFYQAQDQSKAELESLERQLRQVETAIGNLVRAIEMGIFNESTKARMDELTEQQQQIKASIAECTLVNRFQLTRKIIAFFLYDLRNLDTSKVDSQKRIINTFINSIYLYDDHFTIHFNYSGDSTRVKYFDVESASYDISPAEKFGCCLSRCTKNAVHHSVSCVFALSPQLLLLLIFYLLLRSHSSLS